MAATPNDNTWLDGRFWGNAIRESFLPEIDWFARTVQQRVLPVFSAIDIEAEAAADQAWENYMQQPSDGNEDPADYVETAMDAGIEHFTRLSNVRQAIVNMSAVALWHLVEQQMMFFHKRQVLSMQEQDNTNLHTWQKFVRRMKGAGVDLEALASWPKIDELRLVANAVKHGEGNALNALARLRPEMLVPEAIRGEGFPTSRRPHADRPAGGQDLYVTDVDLQEYRNAAMQFWNEVSAEIERQSGA